MGRDVFGSGAEHCARDVLEVVVLLACDEADGGEGVVSVVSDLLGVEDGESCLSVCVATSFEVGGDALWVLEVEGENDRVNRLAVELDKLGPGVVVGVIQGGGHFGG